MIEVVMARWRTGTQVRLTPLELECMKWAADGKSNWEIGHILGIHPKTVNFHIENVKRKFEVSTTIQAVVAALSQALAHHRTGTHDHHSHDRHRAIFQAGRDQQHQRPIRDQ